MGRGDGLAGLAGAAGEEDEQPGNTRDGDAQQDGDSRRADQSVIHEIAHRDDPSSMRQSVAHAAPTVCGEYSNHRSLRDGLGNPSCLAGSSGQALSTKSDGTAQVRRGAVHDAYAMS